MDENWRKKLLAPFYSSIATFNLVVVLTDTEAQQRSRFTREEFHNIRKWHLKITRQKTLIQNPHETCKKQDILKKKKEKRKKTNMLEATHYKSPITSTQMQRDG